LFKEIFILLQSDFTDLRLEHDLRYYWLASPVGLI